MKSFIRNKLNSNIFVSSVLKHSTKYFSGSLIGAIVAVLMNKYYTAVFTPAEFGVLSLYITLFIYLRNLLAFSVDSSAQRVYFDYTGEQRRQFLGTVLVFMTVSAAFWLIIVVAMKDFIIDNLGGTDLIFYMTVLLATLFIYFNLLNRIAYNEHFSKLVFRQSILQTILNHFGSFVLISFGGIGIIARQIAQSIAFFVNNIFYWQGLIKAGGLSIELAFRKDILKRLSVFAVPAFSTTVLTSTFSYLDRIFLNYFHGAAKVGIYSLGYALGQGITIVSDAVSMALFPSVMKELKSDYSSNIKKLMQFDIVFCSGLMIIGVLVFIFRDLIIQFLSNENYRKSADVLPFIVFAFVIGGFYKTVTNVLSYHSVVWFYPFLSFFSFAFTVLLNYILIPRYYEIGAAYAFFVGVFVYSFVVHLIGSKYYFKLRHVVPVYTGIFSLVTYTFLIMAKAI